MNAIGRTSAASAREIIASEPISTSGPLPLLHVHPCPPAQTRWLGPIEPRFWNDARGSFSRLQGGYERAIKNASVEKRARLLTALVDLCHATRIEFESKAHGACSGRLVGLRTAGRPYAYQLELLTRSGVRLVDTDTIQWRTLALQDAIEPTVKGYSSASSAGAVLKAAGFKTLLHRTSYLSHIAGILEAPGVLPRDRHQALDGGGKDNVAYFYVCKDLKNTPPNAWHREPGDPARVMDGGMHVDVAFNVAGLRASTPGYVNPDLRFFGDFGDHSIPLEDTQRLARHFFLLNQYGASALERRFTFPALGPGEELISRGYQYWAEAMELCLPNGLTLDHAREMRVLRKDYPDAKRVIAESVSPEAQRQLKRLLKAV